MSVERIIGLAGRLGQALGESDVHKGLVAAEKKLKEAPASEKEMRALNEQALKIRKLEVGNKPIEPEEGTEPESYVDPCEEDPMSPACLYSM